MVGEVITRKYHKKKAKGKIEVEADKSKVFDSSEQAERPKKAVEKNSMAFGSSTGVLEVGKDESISKINVLPEKAKTLKKRKGGADRIIAQASLSSPEVYSSKLRPRMDLPSFRKVELMENDYEKIVGKRIKVLWPESRRWFKGKIKLFDSKKKLHSVLYDDGDKEELDLTKERFELEVKLGEAFSLISKLRPNLQIQEIDSHVGEIISDAKKDKISDTCDVREDSVKNDSHMSHDAEGMEQVKKFKGEIASNLEKSGSLNLKDVNDNEKDLVEKVKAPLGDDHGETESLTEIASVSSKAVADIAKDKELGGEVFEAADNQRGNDGGQLSLANQKMASTGGSASQTLDKPPPSDEPTKKSGSPINLKSPAKRGRPRSKREK